MKKQEKLDRVREHLVTALYRAQTGGRHPFQPKMAEEWVALGEDCWKQTEDGPALLEVDNDMCSAMMVSALCGDPEFSGLVELFSIGDKSLVVIDRFAAFEPSTSLDEWSEDTVVVDLWRALQFPESESRGLREFPGFVRGDDSAVTDKFTVSGGFVDFDDDSTPVEDFFLSEVTGHWAWQVEQGYAPALDADAVRALETTAPTRS